MYSHYYLRVFSTKTNKRYDIVLFGFFIRDFPRRVPTGTTTYRINASPVSSVRRRSRRPPLNVNIRTSFYYRLTALLAQARTEPLSHTVEFGGQNSYAYTRPARWYRSSIIIIYFAPVPEAVFGYFTPHGRAKNNTPHHRPDFFSDIIFVEKIHVVVKSTRILRHTR